MRFLPTTTLILPLVMVVTLAPARSAGATEPPVVREFIGAEACKFCHKADEKGNQHAMWLKTAHAKAYETLATDAAKKITAAKGLGDNPQVVGECLSCHVTGHGAKPELLGKKYSVAEGVSCESCHGAGGEYKKKAIMEDRAASIAAGLIIPDEKTCRTCHNEKSPSFKGFDFATAYAKIAHPNPLNKAAGGK